MDIFITHGGRLKEIFLQKKIQVWLELPSCLRCEGENIGYIHHTWGASSDCIAFGASDLYSCLMGGLMTEGLVLFGDDAYLNSSFLATPYPIDKSSSCNDYKQYHLQVRVISICVSLLQLCIMKLI